MSEELGLISHLGSASLEIDNNEQHHCKIFDKNTVDYLDCLSQELIYHIKQKHVSKEFLYFAMWIRKRNVETLREKYDKDIRRGYGQSLHIAPSNVPANALFTFAFGLLTGNKCLVKISQRSIAALEPVFKVMRQSLNKNECIQNQIRFFSCSHQDQHLRLLIKNSDLLIVWGGSKTVSKIKELSNNPYQKFIGFPNRSSASILSIDYLIGQSSEMLDKIANNYARDLYFFGQRACTSPRILLIYNPNNRKTWRKDVESFLRLVSIKGENITMQEENIITEYDLFKSASTILAQEEIKEDDCQKYNKLFVYNVDDQKYNYKWGGLSKDGCLRIEMITSLNELSKFTAKNAQTVSHAGLREDEYKMLINQLARTKATRVVKFGNSMNMNALWDGYDLIYEMSKILADV